jgi:hypothetical protein
MLHKRVIVYFKVWLLQGHRTHSLLQDLFAGNGCWLAASLSVLLPPLLLLLQLLLLWCLLEACRVAVLHAESSTLGKGGSPAATDTRPSTATTPSSCLRAMAPCSRQSRQFGEESIVMCCVVAYTLLGVPIWPDRSTFLYALTAKPRLCTQRTAFSRRLSRNYTCVGYLCAGSRLPCAHGTQAAVCLCSLEALFCKE